MDEYRRAGDFGELSSHDPATAGGQSGGGLSPGKGTASPLGLVCLGTTQETLESKAKQDFSDSQALKGVQGMF
jgi:hypothetical protein